MKILASYSLVVAFMCIGAPALAAEPVRIDGSTEAAFDASFPKLVKSLKATERRTLALGLFGALLRHECLAPDAIATLAFSPVTPQDAPRIRPCREQLHNKSYQDILEAAEPAPAPEQPGTSSVPTPPGGSD